MSHSSPLDGSFCYRPSVYLEVDTTRTSYKLYVSVTLPEYESLDLVHSDLEGVLGIARYEVVNTNESSHGLHVFQAILPFEIDSTANLEDRQMTVQVSGVEGGGTVIIHHADADEEGGLPPTN